MNTAGTALRDRRIPAAQKEQRLGISAVICTRDRPRQLKRALQSLLSQVPAPSEVIVIDNAPRTDATRRLVGTEFPSVRYVEAAPPGLNFARNRALRAATQDIIAFLDDDAVAHTDWVARLLDPFQKDARLGACTGLVEPLRVDSEGPRIVEANGGYARGLMPVVLPADARGRLRGRRAPLIAWAVSIGSGCSLALRREAALELGGFDERFGGSNLPGGDDHDMLWRLLAAGYRVGYEPAALAWHEHRPDAAAAYRQIVGHQRGLVAFLAKAIGYGSVSQRAGVVAFLCWRLLKPGVRLARRLAGHDPLPARVLLIMWWHCWRGLLAYAAARKIPVR